MIRKYIFFLLLCMPTLLHADLLSDILCGDYKAQPLAEMIPLADGEHYAMQQGNDIFAYSYKTGAITDTLFTLAGAKTKTPGIAASDLLRMPIEGFIPSPTGRFILVYTNVRKVFRRSFTADYYLYDAKRHELSCLSDTMPLRDPVFSPNGEYIAFSRDNNLYLYKVVYGTEVAVTKDGESGRIYNGTADWLYEEEFSTTAQYAFSPDSKQLAFLRLSDANVPTFSWQNYLDNTYPVLESLRYPKAGEPNPEASICVYDTYYKSIKTMQLSNMEDAYIPRLRWLSDGQLAIFRLNRDQNILEVHYANAKSTLSTLIYREEEKQGWIDFQQIDEWQFLSDNSFVAVSMQDSHRHAWLYSPSGQRLRCLTPEDIDVTCVYGYDEKSMTLFYQVAPLPYNRELRSRQMGAKTKDTGYKRLYTHATGDGISDAVFSTNYMYFVCHHQSVTVASDYTLLDRYGRTLRTLQTNQAVADKAKATGLPQKEFFSFTTERGTTLYGWMLRPKTSGKHPVLVYNYSGPQSQLVLNRWKIDWHEYLAAEEGVMVVCIDPRGTDARGAMFRHETYMNLGEKEAQDQVSLGRWLAQREDVDAMRMAIWGWSGGGYYTIRTMSEPDSPYRCGMAVAAVTDWRLYDSAYTERYMRRPQVNDDGYDAASLLTKADRLNGELLIVHGLADDNVHAQHMLLYTNQLTQHGVQYQMQVYPDDNHFLRKRNNQEHVYRRLLTFLRNQFK